MQSRKALVSSEGEKQTPNSPSGHADKRQVRRAHQERKYGFIIIIIMYSFACQFSKLEHVADYTSKSQNTVKTAHADHEQCLDACRLMSYAAIEIVKVVLHCLTYNTNNNNTNNKSINKALHLVRREYPQRHGSPTRFLMQADCRLGPWLNSACSDDM